MKLIYFLFLSCVSTGCHLYSGWDSAEDIFSSASYRQGVSRWLSYREHLRQASPRDLRKEAVLVSKLVRANGGFEDSLREALINLAVNYPKANPRKALNILTKLYRSDETSAAERRLVAVLIDFNRDVILLQRRNVKLNRALTKQTKDRTELEAKIDALTNIEESLARRQSLDSMDKKSLKPQPGGGENE